MGSRLPDFLLLGAPKCGTSALHAALATHPDLHLSDPKEPKFFLTDGHPPPDVGGGPGDVATWGEHVWRRDDYEQLFAEADPDALCGESTVFYLYDRDAQHRIKALVPDAKLIAVLRDPVERAHSNWAHLRGAGLEPEPDFRRALELEAGRVDAGWAHFWHYAAQGRYGEQLDHLFTLFDPSRVLLLRYAELRNVRHDVSGRADWPTAEERAAAVHRFTDDIPRVAHWTGWDMSAWTARRAPGQ